MDFLIGFIIIKFLNQQGNYKTVYYAKLYMSKIKKRPNNIGIIIVGGIIGLPTGLFLGGLFPEGSDMRLLAGLGDIAAPPIAMLAYSYKKWSEYSDYLKEDYSCLRENGTPTIYDEQAINNDMKAILGT